MTRADRIALRDWLAQGYGLDTDTLGADALAQAVRMRGMATGLPREEDYLERWRHDAAERQALLEHLLVGETWFFRERGAFGLLRQHALARREAARPLRVLCLPCASGEEAWSIAITLHQAGLDAATAHIDAMDLNPKALDTARRGSYGPRAFRTLNPEDWPEYLSPGDAGRFRVADCLRAMVSFRQGNALDAKDLRKHAPFAAIFCRNLMIYMDAPGRTRLCRQLFDTLAEDGLLFLGHAETPPEDSGFVRHGDSAAFAWKRTREPLPAALPKPSPRSEAGRERLSQRATVPPRGLVATPVTANPSPPTPTATDAPIQTARELANQGAYADALRLLERELAQSPLDPDLYALLGILHDLQGRREQAVGHFRRALYLAPGHAESLAHLALLQEQRGNRAEAERLRQRLRQAGAARP